MSLDDPVKTFCHRWGLDIHSENAIRELSIEDQMRVFVGFDPNMSTRNMDSKFMAWLQTFGSAPPARAPPARAAGGGADLLGDFVVKWSLDPQSRQFLETLPTAVTLSVINDFAPPPHTQNVSAKLHAFARLRAVEMGHPELGSLPRGGYGKGGGGYAAGGGGAVFSAYSPAADASPRRVNGAGASLQQAPQLTAEFCGGRIEDVAEFCVQWGLDDTCLASLQSLPDSLRQEVMFQFAPKEGTRNTSALLLAFIRQRRVGHGEGPTYVAAAPALSFQQPARQTQVESVSDQDISSFVQRWGLDDACGSLVQTLPPTLQWEVMLNFAPKEGTRNPSALLHAFVRARRQGHDPGAVIPQPTTSGYPAAYAAASTAVDSETIRQFTDFWGLDDDARRMLERLSGEVLINVLSHFEPPPATENVSAKLHAFIRGVQEKLGQRPPRSIDRHPGPPPRAIPARAANAPWNVPNASGAGFVPAPRQPAGHGYAACGAFAGDEIEHFVAKWGLDPQCDSMLRQLGPEHQAAVILEFAPQPGTVNINGKLHGFVRSITASHVSSGPASTPVPGEPVGAFLAQWGLDAAAEAAIRSASVDVQEAVMAEFMPAPGTLNTSGKLCAFVRAKQSRERFFGASGADEWSLGLQSASSVGGLDAPTLSFVLPDGKRPRLG